MAQRMAQMMIVAAVDEEVAVAVAAVAGTRTEAAAMAGTRAEAAAVVETEVAKSAESETETETETVIETRSTDAVELAAEAPMIIRMIDTSLETNHATPS